MEIKSVKFDKVNKNTKNQFQKSAKINYIQPIASAKCLNRRENNRISSSVDNNKLKYNNCRRVCNNRKIIVKKTTTFQGQHLRVKIFQNVSNQLLNFDSMGK